MMRKHAPAPSRGVSSRCPHHHRHHRLVRTHAVPSADRLLMSALDKVLNQITRIMYDHEAKQRRLRSSGQVALDTEVQAPGKKVSFQAGSSSERLVKEPAAGCTAAGRGLSAYLSLPLDQYALLDPRWITRPDPVGAPDVFVLKVPLQELIHVALQPQVTIKVEVDTDNCQVRFSARSFRVGDVRFDQSFTLDMDATLSHKPVTDVTLGSGLAAAWRSWGRGLSSGSSGSGGGGDGAAGGAATEDGIITTTTTTTTVDVPAMLVLPAPSLPHSLQMRSTGGRVAGGPAVAAAAAGATLAGSAAGSPAVGVVEAVVVEQVPVSRAAAGVDGGLLATSVMLDSVLLEPMASSLPMATATTATTTASTATTTLLEIEEPQAAGASLHVSNTQSSQTTTTIVDNLATARSATEYANQTTTSATSHSSSATATTTSHSTTSSSHISTTHTSTSSTSTSSEGGDADGAASEEGSGAATTTAPLDAGVLKCSVDLRFRVLMPAPLSVVPGPMLALAGGLLARFAVRSLLPGFLELLSVDYARWATGSGSRSQAAGSLVAPSAPSTAAAGSAGEDSVPGSTQGSVQGSSSSASSSSSPSSSRDDLSRASLAGAVAGVAAAVSAASDSVPPV